MIILLCDSVEDRFDPVIHTRVIVFEKFYYGMRVNVYQFVRAEVFERFDKIFTVAVFNCLRIRFVFVDSGIRI